MDENLINQTIEEYDVALEEEIVVDISESMGWVRGDERYHSSLLGIEDPNQHPITSIGGLRDELDEIEALKSVYSDSINVANYYKWENNDVPDGHGYFVSLAPGSTNIKICNGSDIFGVSVDTAGFIGNEGYEEIKDGDGVVIRKVRQGRGNEYGLVATSGVVKVRCTEGVAVGDYVVSNEYGVAKKTESGCGYKVISLAEKVHENEIQYAIISLGVQACTTDVMGAKINRLESDMEEARLNIRAAITEAQLAREKAEASDNTSTSTKDEVKGEVEDLGDRVDGVEGDINNLKDVMDAYKNAINEAIALQDTAIASANTNSTAAISKAGEIEGKFSDLAKSWTFYDENGNETSNQGASYVVDYMENGLKTKAELEVVSKFNEENKLLIEKTAESYRQTAMSVDKYCVGEYSQAYGLTLEQAQNAMQLGMVYIPDNSHVEIYRVDDVLKAWFGTEAPTDTSYTHWFDEKNDVLKKKITSESGDITWTEDVTNGWMHFKTSTEGKVGKNYYIWDENGWYEAYDTAWIGSRMPYDDDCVFWYSKDNDTLRKRINPSWIEIRDKVWGGNSEPDSSYVYWFDKANSVLRTRTDEGWTEHRVWIGSNEQDASSYPCWFNNGVLYRYESVWRIFDEPMLCGVDEDADYTYMLIDGVVYTRLTSLETGEGELVEYKTHMGADKPSDNSVFWNKDGVIYSRWCKVASVSGNVNRRITSMINQEVDSITAEVVNAAGSVASFDARITETESRIGTLTTWATGEDGKQYNLADIRQKANDAGASITQIVEAVGEDGKVNAASIVAAVNEAGSSVVLNADHVKFDGFVSFANKSDVDEVKKNAVYDTKVEYALSSSQTEFIAVDGASGQWSTTAPAWNDGSYMWQQITITKGDESAASTKTCIQGANGSDGSSLLVKYINSETAPTIIDNDVTSWSDSIPTVESGKKTYMTQKMSNETNWSTPVQISAKDGVAPKVEIIDGYWVIDGESSNIKAEGKDGDSPAITVGDNGNWYIDGNDSGQRAQGEAGKDGNCIEYVYYRSKDEQSSLAAPTYTDENLTSGWTESPQGITSEYKYEYMSMRTKAAGTDTVWSSFSNPVIWSKWGEKGQDGDGVEYKYCLINSPIKPTYPATDDSVYVWTDEPSGVSELVQYEYVVQIKRTTSGGTTTTSVSNVALWAKWSKDGDAANEVVGEERQFHISDSDEGAPDSESDGWSTTPVNYAKGKYLWARNVYMMKNGNRINGDAYLDKTFTTISNWCAENDQTLIDGGYIATNSIEAKSIKVDDLSAFEANIGGWEISENEIAKKVDGVSMVGMYSGNIPYQSLVNGNDESPLRFYAGSTSEHRTETLTFVSTGFEMTGTISLTEEEIASHKRIIEAKCLTSEYHHSDVISFTHVFADDHFSLGDNGDLEARYNTSLFTGWSNMPKYTCTCNAPDPDAIAQIQDHGGGEIEIVANVNEAQTIVVVVDVSYEIDEQIDVNVEVSDDHTNAIVTFNSKTFDLEYSIDFDLVYGIRGFVVLEDGSLYANAANISGSIHSADGDIAGWEISEDGICKKDAYENLLVGMHSGDDRLGSLVSSLETSPIRFCSGGNVTTVHIDANNVWMDTKVRGTYGFKNYKPIKCNEITALIFIKGGNDIDGTPYNVEGFSWSYDENSCAISFSAEVSPDVRSEILDAGSGNWYVYLECKILQDYNFAVLEDGSLRASAVDLEGSVNAIDGKIGQLIISEGSLKSSSDTGSGYEITSGGIKFYDNNASLSFGDNLRIETIPTGSEGLPDVQIKASAPLEIGGSSASIFLNTESSDTSVTRNFAVYADYYQKSGGLLGKDRYVRVWLSNTDVGEYQKLLYDQHITFKWFSYIEDNQSAISSGTADVVWPLYSSTACNKADIQFTSSDGGANIKFVLQVWVDNTLISSSSFLTSEHEAEGGVFEMDSFFGTCSFTQVQRPNNIIFKGNLIPYDDDDSGVADYNLGRNNRRWNTIFCQTSNVESSDKNLKNNIQLLNPKYSQLFDSLRPVSYKFNKNSSNRTHIGFIAQDVEDGLEQSGLTSQDFAGLCYWDNDDGTRGYGLRYGEFIALCVDEIQKLKKRVEELEDKLNNTK